MVFNRHAVPRPFVLGDLAIDRATRRMAEQGQHAGACQVAGRHVARHKEPLPAIARRAMKLDTRPQAMHARRDLFNPTKHRHGG